MSKLNKYSGSYNLAAFAILIFIFLPFVKTSFTIDNDLAPKFFITSVFVFFYSLYFFFLNRSTLEISDSIRKIFYVVISIQLWMVYETIFSINKGDAFVELSRVAVLYSIFFISFTIFRQSSNQLTIICRASAFAVIIFLIISVVQLYAPRAGVMENKEFIFSNVMISSLANKNFFSEVLVLFLPILIIGASNDNYYWKKIFKGVLFLNLCFIVILHSIAAWVAIFTSIIYFVILTNQFNVRIFNFYNPNQYRSVTKILLALVLLGGLILYSYTSNFNKLTVKLKTTAEYISNPSLLSTTRVENNNSTFERLVIWRNSFKMISEYPIKGIGLNNWKIENPAYGIGGTQYINSGYVNYEHPHNDYLLIWAEQGTVGIVLYLLLFFLIFREGFRFLKQPHGNSVQFMILLLTGIFSFMILSLFAYPRSRFYSMILLMILFALIISRDSDSKGTAISIKPVAFVMFIISFFGIIASGYRTKGEMHTKKLQVYQLRQDFSRMIREADKAYSWYYPMDLTSTPLSWYKGMAYFDSGLKKDAIREYEKALIVNPNHLRLLNDIATVYEQSNMRDKAIYYYRKALDISPLFLEANLNISAAYFNDNKIDSAFYFIDRIYNPSFNLDGVINYKEFLDAILYAKSLEIIKTEKDTLAINKMMILVNEKDTLKHIYRLSKEEKQPFAKYLMNKSKFN